MHTTMWDAKYPDKEGGAQGPCQNSSNAHCGTTLVPDAAEQVPYLPVDFVDCTTTQGT
ncbi:MAG: hypothetical protein ACJAT1_000671, partial [Marivirga sp.]|jgi:hypothetical protein